MTGNPNLTTFWGTGSYSTDYRVTGVRLEDVAESHRAWWKKPKQGITAPYKKHHLYPKGVAEPKNPWKDYTIGKMPLRLN